MKPKALVVEDDPMWVDNTIREVMLSLDHEFDWAASQQQARELIGQGGTSGGGGGAGGASGGGGYSYVLLDLEIPAHSGPQDKKATARVQNGYNLIREILAAPTMAGVPIIVMTAHCSSALGGARELFLDGVADFAPKSESNDCSPLDVVIRDVLQRRSPKAGTRGAGSAAGAGAGLDRVLIPFRGGEMVFFPDRVELCGIKIAGDTDLGPSRQILDALRQRLPSRPDGGLPSYRAYDGSSLARQIGLATGQNGVAGCIRDLRKKISKLLGDQLGLEVGQSDVIQSGGPGYRLNEWIVTSDGSTAAPGALSQSASCDSVAGAGPALPYAVGTPTGSDPPAQRRCWIAAELAKGRKLRTPDIADELQCSVATVKRDLQVMVAKGAVSFNGPSKTGYYVLQAGTQGECP